MISSPTPSDHSRSHQAASRSSIEVVPFGVGIESDAFGANVHARTATLLPAHDLTGLKSTPKTAKAAAPLAIDLVVEDYASHFGTPAAKPASEILSMVAPISASRRTSTDRYRIGAELGRGVEKRAMELSFLDADQSSPEALRPLVALLPQRALHQNRKDNVAHELVRHEHYRRIQEQAPQIGAEYLGLVHAEGATRDQPVLGHVFERMGGTMGQFADAGGLAQGITWGGHKVLPGDLLAASIMLASRYEDATKVGFAFMDPKPDNFGVHLRELPVGARVEAAEVAAGASPIAAEPNGVMGRLAAGAKGFLGRFRVQSSAKPTYKHEPLIADVKFIDLDSFRTRPHDVKRDGESVAFTPAFIPPQGANAYLGGSIGQELQDAMTRPESMVWVAGASLMAMTLGRAPQEKHHDQWWDKQEAAGAHAKLDSRAQGDLSRVSYLRLRAGSDGLYEDFKDLDGLVEQKSITPGYASLIKDSLGNKIRSLDDFRARAADEMRLLGMRPPGEA